MKNIRKFKQFLNKKQKLDREQIEKMKILSFICLAGVLIMALVVGGLNTEYICVLGEIRVTNAPVNSIFPSIAVDTNNNVHISWTDHRGGYPMIYYKKYDNDGNALTRDTRVTEAVSFSSNPSIAVDTNNNIYISWEDKRDGYLYPMIYYKKYDNNGNALTKDIRVTNTMGRYSSPSIAIDSDNNVHISWVNELGGKDVYYKKYDNKGNALTGDIRVTRGVANFFHLALPSQLTQIITFILHWFIGIRFIIVNCTLMAPFIFIYS